ncbi:uncharacterized protein LOC116620251 [Nematostella vectensis]|uniref:uncharacterized protein LOC116620251 n=1 Tax=Nematostella vectensis TaxID=45351 RepID=UPI00139007B5|nr:uncharacterized protein LOC116620251 [Nematostella vectensis]
MSFSLLDLNNFFEQKGPGFLAEASHQNQMQPTIGIYFENPENLSNAVTEKTRTYKTDQNRRARNVISSRKYRAKKRRQFLQLEDDNRVLQESINMAQKELEQLNQAFRMFIQHAEKCITCSHVQLNFD